MVTTRNVVYAAFSLLASLIGVAGLFLIAFAEFLALVQVLIYGGAIVIVILFALMLTRIQDFENLSGNQQWPIAAIVSAALFVLLAASVFVTTVKTVPDRQAVYAGRVGANVIRAVGRPLRDRFAGAARGLDRGRGYGRGEREARMIELAHFQIVAAALFAIGLYGVLSRRSAVLILMSIELMLNAVNINLIGFAAFADIADPSRALGQVIVVFVITIAAAELALALAIILRLYRNRSTVNVDEVNLMKW